METDEEDEDGQRDQIDLGGGHSAKINLDAPILEFKRFAWIALLSYKMEKSRKVV